MLHPEDSKIEKRYGSTDALKEAKEDEADPYQINNIKLETIGLKSYETSPKRSKKKLPKM